MRNSGLDEAQAGIKIAGRNISNLRHADDTTLMAESEELKSLSMKQDTLKASALGQPRGMGGRGRWEWVFGWETHVHLWLIHVSVWQKPPQYYKLINLQLK